ncbi:superoxide dismutase family protein [Sphingorhabdus arenilitoris]|uniref:Superoxide dismutase family protein n=1 Tax=Sphingorhabdus arenilitoris TaxID=1490041 RepID=A0ABV8RHH0_9SPHN
MHKFMALGAVAMLAACGSVSEPAKEAPVVATAKLMRGDAEVGTVTLTQKGENAEMSFRVEGLPTGGYGFHIHETGKCEGPDYKSAGGHWNPAGKEHGLENPKGAHAGDLPNLAGVDGQVTRLERSLTGLKITGEGGMMDADGAAIMIHAKPDDNKTDPSGESGDRIICGVFELEK